jgi:integrase
MSVRLPTGVSLRGSVFYIRIGLPEDLRNLWPRLPNGKPATDAYRASLNTRNRDEAITKAYKLLAEFRDRFAALRAASSPAPFVAVRPTLATRFAEEAKRLAYASTNRTRIGANPSDDPSRWYAEEIAESWGIRVDWASADGLACLDQISRAVTVTSRESVPVGTTRPTGATTPATIPRENRTPTTPSMTLRDVVPYWIRRNASGKSAQGDMDRALRLFEAAVGHVPLPDITKATGAKFVAALLDEKSGFGRKTAGNRASAITALVNVAIKEDLMDRNPMDLSFDTAIGARQRTPWTDKELATIFGSSLFSEQTHESYDWVAVNPNDARAILLLLLHTGARVGEIAQLRCQDFVKIDGILAVRITAEAGTVKTTESERYVPLADHLLADPWFADWLTKTMRRTGVGMSSLHGREHGPGETFTRWFAKLRKALRLPSGGLYGTHKFRHWIRSSLASKNVNESIADSITGHAAQGSSGRRIYTATASLPTMLEALNRLSYPRICGIEARPMA